MGGALLAGSAGFVNAALLSFFKVPVSHKSVLSPATSIVWLDFRVLYLPAAGTLGAAVAYYVRATRRARNGGDLRLAYGPRRTGSGGHAVIGGEQKAG